MNPSMRWPHWSPESDFPDEDPDDPGQEFHQEQAWVEDRIDAEDADEDRRATSHGSAERFLGEAFTPHPAMGYDEDGTWAGDDPRD